MKKILLFTFFFLVLAAAMIAVSCSHSRAKVMGTWVEVRGGDAGIAVAEIRRLEKLFSRFDPSSEVSLINRVAGKGSILVSKDTFRVIEQACRISDLSHGAFDITLGKGGSSRDIILDKKVGKIGLRRRGMEIDLGGIGKGYAVEAARKALLSRGILHSLIDMHSSMAAIGGPWKIGIRNPMKKNKTLGVVELNDGEALSTSANYEQPGHLVDPRTGKPADRCLSVSVICLDAGWADALSTAIFILGPEEGMKLAKQQKVNAVIIDRRGIIHDNFGFKLRQLVG